MTSAFRFVDRGRNEEVCEWVGGLGTFMYNLGLMYTLVLGLELLMKFKHVTTIAYYKRSISYHVLAISVSCTVEILILLFYGYGISIYGTCGIKNPEASIIESFPRVITTISLIIISFLLLKEVKTCYSKLIWNYCLIIIFVILTWCVPGILASITRLVNNNSVMLIGYYSGSLSGTIIGCCRILNSKIVREIKKKMMSKEKRKALLLSDARFYSSSVFGSLNENLIRKDSKQANTTSINCFSDLYENISKKLKLEIFSCLFIYFSHISEENPSDPQPGHKKGVNISKSDLTSLEYLLKESETRYLKNSKILFRELKPKTFFKLRSNFTHTNNKIIQSLHEQLSISYEDAKVIENASNNSFVIITSDQKYVIKSITKEEKQIFFRFLLEPYTKRVLSSPDSRLIRILGVFQIVTSKVAFFVMENSANIDEGDLVFDLKGSLVDRYVKPIKGLKNQVLKDENFRVSGKRIKCGVMESMKIINEVKEDLRILKEIGIMDYSLLLVVKAKDGEENRYSIGKRYYLAIIDLFQVYNGKKAVERWFKIWVRRVDRGLISVVSPDEYFQRIMNFLGEMFSENEEYEFSILKN